jgi:eukaryotic-like serine/threonine-protein kinase
MEYACGCAGWQEGVGGDLAPRAPSAPPVDRRQAPRFIRPWVFCPRCRKEYSPARRFCPEDGARLRANISESTFHAKGTKKAGAIFGSRYQVKGLMGTGGTARAYLADDLFMKRAVVLKLLSPTTDPSGAIKERFAREAKVAIEITHPNVVKTLDAGVKADGTPYLVLESLMGETLGDYLKREPVMDADAMLTVLRQAAAGLGAVHKAGFVHRDVKPDNIFLVGEVGSAFGVKIIDFGFATQARKSRASVAGMVLGTPQYIAPEQVVSDPTDARTDVYGLGAVMFRALSGKLPFQVDDDMCMLAHHLLSPAPPVRSARADVDPRFEVVIESCLRKHPDNRYASMDLVAAELDRIVGVLPGDPVSAPMQVLPDRYEIKSALGQNAEHVFKDALTRRR